MIRLKVFLGLSAILFMSLMGIKGASLAKIPTASQIEKTQEDLEKEKALRELIEEGQKVFIKKIIIKGVTLLTQEEIKDIVQPFQKHWLSQGDVQQILEMLKQTYKEKGYPGQPAKILTQIEKGQLIIEITEIKE